MMDILGKIIQLKNERNWSTYKLAEESGITQSTLANMFSRKTMPSIQTLSNICSAFGITLSEFFEESTPKDMSVEDKRVINKYLCLNSKNKNIVKNLIDNLSE